MLLQDALRQTHGKAKVEGYKFISQKKQDLN
ncbi:hypothetical protein ACVW06_003653 [Pantoea ananatis]|nr:hypothetical protein [Pantoea ananatis]MCW0350600.1 hypothetical protein [Pantoea ananatis]